MFQAMVAIQETERAVSRDKRSIEGLCRNCASSDTCTFPRDTSRPVWSCDEFEGLAPAPTASFVAAPVLSLVRENPAEPTEFKGLCKQCAHRFACVYPKPIGGVWHCDELA